MLHAKILVLSILRVPAFHPIHDNNLRNRNVNAEQRHQEQKNGEKEKS